ncbi:MAG TPA: hypothetical protein VMW91_02800 [Desulfosporosinus sp.]|nr:hypothetical protein [Desulfosporosinus sp.]
MIPDDVVEGLQQFVLVIGECCAEGQVIGGVITPKNTVGDVKLLNQGPKFS